MKLLLLPLFLLAGCQSFGGYNQMTPEQIAAATKDKSAVCISVPTPAGVAKIVLVDITHGEGVAVSSDNCSIVTTTQYKPVPTPVPTPVKP